MYGIKLEDYVPEPQPATSRYIVAAHYYAAWKRGAAELHKGFEELKNYPERTPLEGYYDEENPELCDWEIKWAVEHGINCFIHCWYRRKWNVNHPVTPEALRCGHGLHEALFNARYQKYMKFAIMFEVSERWGASNKNDMLDNLMPFWMENYFTRGNYLVIDNKPVLFVYEDDRVNQLRDAFASVEEQRETFDRCREYAKKFGFDGMIFAAKNQTLDPAVIQDHIDRGYDFRFCYNYWYEGGKPFPPGQVIVDDQKRFFETRLALDPMRYTVTASCMWDPSPRLAWQKSNTDGFWHLEPEEFRQVVRNCREMADSLPEGAIGRRLIMLDNWNEWDEGHFLSPSMQFGFKMLQAVREELTERDNLPDYRTPQDMGLDRLNRNWPVPDFSDFKDR